MSRLVVLPILLLTALPLAAQPIIDVVPTDFETEVTNDLDLRVRVDNRLASNG